MQSRDNSGPRRNVPDASRQRVNFHLITRRGIKTGKSLLLKGIKTGRARLLEDGDAADRILLVSIS